MAIALEFQGKDAFNQINHLQSGDSVMDRYLVIGNPISHSLSPLIHRLFAAQTGQELDYTTYQCPTDAFAEHAAAFFADGGRGCNVTVPFKQDAANFATKLTPRAELAGAVNTLKPLDDGPILGDNTDGAGLVQDLRLHGISCKGQHVLLVGAGGAARGVLLPLLEQQPAQITITNRTFAKAQALAELFSPYGAIQAVPMEQLEHVQPQLIINATSASLQGQRAALPGALIQERTVVYDMMYGAQDTAFISWAREQGAHFCLDGLGMLVAQAAESFALWRGIRPGGRAVLAELRRNLG